MLLRIKSGIVDYSFSNIDLSFMEDKNNYPWSRNIGKEYY